MSASISPEERFSRIQSLLLEASRAQASNQLLAARAELTVLREQYQAMLASTQEYAEQVKMLEKQIKELDQPPLLHALLIGRNDEKETFVVSIGGQRYDVNAAPPEGSGLDLADLVQGTEVLVTRDTNAIVGIVGPHRSGESAQVLDVLKNDEGNPDGRLLVRWGGNEGTVVEMAPSLLSLPDPPEAQGETKDRIKTRPVAGDLVLVDTAAKMAFEKLPSHETSELELEEDPEGAYEDIAGLDDKIELIKDAIELPYLHRDLFAKEKYDLERPSGILLYGPPGCGKTMIGRAVANGLKDRIGEQLTKLIRIIEAYQEAKRRGAHEEEISRLRRSFEQEAPEDLRHDLRLDLDRSEETIRTLQSGRQNTKRYFLNIKGPELLSKWVGEAEHRIRQVFSVAKRKASYTTPVVVFFDEIESMFQRRGTGISTDLEKTMVPQLLTELDGIEELRNVVVIGASNRHELLDPALTRPGRLDMKVKIDRPDRAATQQIFRLYLVPTLPLSADGLVDSSWASFDNEISQVLERLFDSDAYLSIRTGSSPVSMVSLRQVLSDSLLSEVVTRVRENALARTSASGGDRRAGYSDLTSAIEQVVRQHPAQLADSRVPVDGGLTVVLKLDAAEKTLGETRLPALPLAPASPNASDGMEQPLPDRGHLAQLMIDLAVETIFSPHSYLLARVLAKCGREHTFLLREFVSGALVKNMVDRAKRLALKRETKQAVAGKSAPREAPSDSGADAKSPGITGQDLLDAIRAEYEENKDQFIANKPEVANTVCDTCRRPHNSAEEYDIEVLLGRSPRDRWHLTRRRPYERGRGARTT